MMQNRSWAQWGDEEVLKKLKSIMEGIFKSAKECADKYDVSLSDGANIAAFLRAAEAAKAQGAV